MICKCGCGQEVHPLICGCGCGQAIVDFNDRPADAMQPLEQCLCGCGVAPNVREHNRFISTHDGRARGRLNALAGLSARQPTPADGAVVADVLLRYYRENQPFYVVHHCGRHHYDVHPPFDVAQCWDSHRVLGLAA